MQRLKSQRAILFQRLSNGSIDPDSDVTRVIELQETVEKQNSELTATRTRVLELTNRCTELEESYNTTQKELTKAQEQLVKLQRDLREVGIVMVLAQVSATRLIFRSQKAAA